MSDSRLEKFIYAICSMEVSDLPTPLSRIEILWNCLITGETPDFEPLSRNEKYLMAMLGLYELENLPTPMSRGEKLLYKIAMGETDLSDIPAYLSRYEELLGYLVENGGVGDFEYILQTLNQRVSTLYSTKERPMKQVVIKGDTLVNELPRPSLKNTMTNVASQKLNQGYDNSPHVVDGEFKSAILKGQTLVNGLSNPIIKVGGEYVTTISPTHLVINHGENTLGKRVSVNYEWLGGKMRDGADYTLDIWILKNTMRRKDDPTAKIGKINFNNYNTGYYSIPTGKTGHIVYEVTTPTTSTTERPYIETLATCEGELEIQMVIREGKNLIPIEQHFEGMASCKMPVLKTVGKNLFPPLTEYDSITQNVTGEEYELTERKIVWNSEKIYTPSIGYYFNLKPNTKYTFSCSKEGNPEVIIFDRHSIDWDSNHSICAMSTIETTVGKRKVCNFTTRSDGKVCIRLSNSRGYTVGCWIEDCSLTEFDNNNTHVYEPYKTNILTINEGVTLRGIGDIQDEMNLFMGKVTERIGEIVIDGSDDENWRTGNPTNDTFISFLLDLEDGKQDSCNFANNKLANKKVWNEVIEGIWVDTSVVLTFKRTSLPTQDLTGARQWLSQNPITVQHELATELIKRVDLTITDQDGVTQTKLHSFNDGYLSVSSQGVLPSAINYEVPTNNSYYLPDMLTLGAQYTSRGSAACNATIDGKLFALGTNKTFTTPTSLTDRLMVLDTPVDDLMFIKGDQTAKDLGYFEGMKSVELSNIKVTGKNLFDTATQKLGYFWSSLNIYTEDSGSYVSDTYVKVKPGDNLIANNIEGFVQYMEFDSNKQFIQRVNKGVNIVYVVPKYVEYLRFSFFGCGEGFQCQVEKGTVATPYEPYKSTTLTLNEPVTLRKVGDVQDTLDGLTGELISSVGEVLLDGSQKKILSQNWGNYAKTRFELIGAKETVKTYEKAPLLSDKLKPYGYWGEVDKGEYFFTTTNAIDIVHSRDKNMVLWLKDNPTLVAYPLLESITKTVDLTTVDQDGQPTKLKTFNDISYVEIDADNMIPSVDVEVATKTNETLSTMGLEHHDISETQNELDQTIEEQSENTDATMMATTEICEQIL